MPGFPWSFLFCRRGRCVFAWFRGCRWETVFVGRVSVILDGFRRDYFRFPAMSYGFNRDILQNGVLPNKSSCLFWFKQRVASQAHVACGMPAVGKDPAAWKAVRDGVAQRCLPHECHAYITWNSWSRISASIAFADDVHQWPHGERLSCSRCIMVTTFPWPLWSPAIADCIVDWILRSKAPSACGAKTAHPGPSAWTIGLDRRCRQSFRMTTHHGPRACRSPSFELSRPARGATTAHRGPSAAPDCVLLCETHTHTRMAASDQCLKFTVPT